MRKERNRRKSLARKGGRHIIVARNDDTWEGFPDLTATRSGKLICVYKEGDGHGVWDCHWSRIVIRESEDRGRTWSEKKILDEKNDVVDGGVYCAPAISRLKDGRIVSSCEFRNKDIGFTGAVLWWSTDEGKSWSKGEQTGIHRGGETPIIDLQDGSLLMGFDYTSNETGKSTQAVVRSDDGGRTWGKLSIVAKDSVHDFGEASFTELPDGTIISLLREDSYCWYPTYKCYSYDHGKTWSTPMETPIFAQRPMAGLLKDGKMLVTYRHVGGNVGAYAWMGDPLDNTAFRIPGRHMNDNNTKIEKDFLHINNDGTKRQYTQYFLHPPEDIRSDIFLEAELRCLSNSGNGCSIWIAQAARINIFPKRIELEHNPYIGFNLDATEFHTYKIIRKNGTLAIIVDGKQKLMTDELDEKLSEFNWISFGNQLDLKKLSHPSIYPIRGFLPHYVYPSNSGESLWKKINLSIINPTLPDHDYSWIASQDKYPDQYEIDHILELDGFTQTLDQGHTGWVQFSNGEFFCVNYVSEGAPVGAHDLNRCQPDRGHNSYIKGTYFREEDFGS